MVGNINNDELRAIYSPDGSLLRKQQIRLLEILVYIDRKCRENHIQYWLSSGTALGAIRHSGFIPWDDDIDIEMTMSDYRKFEVVMEHDTNYVLQTRHTDKFYSAPYAKVRDLHSIISETPQDGNYLYKGLYVDVFIIEKSPSLLVASLFQRMNWSIVLSSGKQFTPMGRRVFFAKRSLYYFLRDIVRGVYFLIPTDTYRHTLGSGFQRKIRHMTEIFPLTEVEFEKHKFYAPRDIDSYLTHIYGDYMKLPAIDDIHQHMSDVIIDD